MSAAVKHLISGNELSGESMLNIIFHALELKKNPSMQANFLNGAHIALLFEKPSLRTRFSFTAAVNQLGGHVIESVSQTRKNELPQDLIRVIQGYCKALMIRTFDESFLDAMKEHADIPIINGLTNLYHPCQSLADLMTLLEVFKRFDGLQIAYLGDGNNVLHSLLMMSNKLGIKVKFCCPPGFGPKVKILEALENPALFEAVDEPIDAVKGCQAVYTDVWTSMGFENRDESFFKAYQVNEALMACAKPEAVFMHCMPMERGKEVSVGLPDAPNSVIFKQSENRMHVQKALLVNLLSGGE